MRYFIIAVFALLRFSQAYYQRKCTLHEHSTQYICADAGATDDPTLAPPFEASSFELCRDIALATLTYPSVKAASFSFDTENSQCSVYDHAIPGFQQNASSTQYFYEPNCFECIISCPLEYGVNLLINSGLEIGQGTVLPWTQEVTKPGHHSKHAAITPLGMFQTMPLCNNATYKLAFYYKIVGDASNFAFWLQYLVAGLRRSIIDALGGSLFASDTNGKWIRFEDIIIVPAENISRGAPPELQLRLGNHKKAQMLMDDIQFYAIDPVAARTPKPGSKNAFRNAGFESGELEPWFTYFNYGGPGNATDHGRFSVVSPGIKSDHGLLCKSLTRDSIYFFLNQNVTTTPLTQYVFKFDYQIMLRPNVQRSTGTLKLEYISFGKGGNLVSVTKPSFKRHRKEGVYSEAVPIAADGETLGIQLEFFSQNGEDFLFDNFQFVESSSQL